MARLSLKSVPVTTNLEQFVIEVLPQDLQATLVYVFATEEQRQRQIGQTPTGFLYDGRKGELVTVKHRAQAFYGDPARLTKALNTAWDLLIRTTRIKTGAARASYMLYLRKQALGGREAIPLGIKLMKENDYLSIVGPTVAYGRKLYWRPITGSTMKKKRQVASIANTQYVATYIEPAARSIKRILRSRYSDLYISDKWIEGTQLGDRWPALRIGFRGTYGEK